MKNNILTKTFCFLENHIALILGLFFPVWLGILIALGVVLNLLPFEISHRLTLRLMHVPFVILGSLVIIAIIAILRMVRDVRDRKLKQIFLYMFLIALDLIFMSLFFVWFTSLQLKQDTANITSNLSLISKRLYAYQEEHGGYPPQQELESLLETLGIQESDFYRTYYFDIHSAEYHAPAGDSNDPEYRLVTLRAKDHLRFVRRDGSVGCEYLKNTHAGAAK
jgi:hypothetical protein